MIKFNYTQQGENGMVEYLNEKFEVVRKYNLDELKNYVINIAGSGQVTYPTNIEKEIDLYTDVDDYIDLHWEEVTEAFYNFKNKEEFLSQNKPQQTLKQII